MPLLTRIRHAKQKSLDRPDRDRTRGAVPIAKVAGKGRDHVGIAALVERVALGAGQAPRSHARTVSAVSAASRSERRVLGHFAQWWP